MLRRKTTLLLILVLVFNLSFAAMCDKKSETRARQLAKISDDVAEGLVSTANLLNNAKTTGLITQEDVNEIKPFLLQVQSGNAKAITLARSMLTTAEPTNDQKAELTKIIGEVSSALVRANNVGLFRIKDPNTRIAFSTLILTLQSTVTSAITIINMQKGTQ